MNRRDFIKMVGMGTAGMALPFTLAGKNRKVRSKINKPNIILMMTDDMGWGDVGFNRNQVIKTPCLDKLANDGIRFNYFFSGGPVCSPTRGTCLTGRHYYRYGIWSANQGRLPKQEITIPEILRNEGYLNGHFGKWHLGSPTEEYSGKGSKHKAFPEWFGYNEYFVTHHAVKLWDPFGPNGEEAVTSDNPYWYYKEGDKCGKRVLENITGDDSCIIMDRVIPFVRNSHEQERPFFTVIWFHTPHGPIDAGPEYRKMYSKYSVKEQKYFGAITAMDEQVGRLRKELEKIGEADNTMWWFCSDNGPITPGETGGLRGGKRSLFSGGVGVPAFLYWPGHADAGREVDICSSTLDYFPTIMDYFDLKMPDDRPIDGISLLPMIAGKMSERAKAIPFRFHANKNAMHGSPTISLIKGKCKFLTNLSETGEEDLLFDIYNDWGEQNNIVDKFPKIAAAMKKEAREFVESAKRSHSGVDYDDPDYKPAEEWKAVTGDWAGGKSVQKGESQKKSGKKSPKK